MKKTARGYAERGEINPPAVYVDSAGNIRGATNRVYLALAFIPYRVWVQDKGSTFRIPSLEGVDMSYLKPYSGRRPERHTYPAQILRQCGYEIVE